MIKKKSYIIIFSLLLLCLFFAFLGLCIGSVSIPFKEVFPSLFTSSSSYSVIIRSLRLPRVLGALLSGIALSTAGFLLQRVTGNELASPSVVGVNSGAGFGVMIVLCFFPLLTSLLPLAAFLGAFIAVLLVMLVSSLVRSHQSALTLVLSGVAISALFSSGIAFLSQLYPDVLTSYVYFSSGGFSGVRMKDLLLPSILIVVCSIVAFALKGELNLLSLGEDLARSHGVNWKRMKWISLLLVSLLTGASVSYAGLLGFVGLMVPHIASKLVGNDARVQLPVSCLLGSILVILADLLGRSLFSPSEISAGIILSFIGAPFFLFLLFKKGGRHGN